MDAQKLRILTNDKEIPIANHVSQDELNRVYETFNTGITRLHESILVMNDTIKDFQTENYSRYSDLDQRLKKLESDRTIRDTQKTMAFGIIKMFPKTFGILLFILCAGIVKISESLSTDEKHTTEELRHVIAEINRSTP